MLFLTLTLMPALIEILMTPAASRKLAARGPARTIRFPQPRPTVVMGSAGVLLLGSLALMPYVGD